MPLKPVPIGIIGCGAISGAYIKNCAKFEILRTAAVADVIPEIAKAKAEEFGIPRAVSVEDLLADPEIEIVVNLTVPRAHFEVGVAAVRAGKSVWNEKPLAAEREDGKLLLTEAKRHGVLVGCAPDTFLGAAHQTCRKLIDDGAIGKPVAASAFMMGHGMEGWHPNPEFFYKRGGGPMFDMGPYYLTALVTLMGPATRVSGSAKISVPERIIGAGPRRGAKIVVETPTHVTGVVDFANGAVATVITSFDVWASQLPRIEIYGTEGTLSVPDPNGPGGTPRVKRAGDEDWSDVPLSHSYTDTARGIGVADMAYALRSGRAHRASGELAYHVLDLMHGFLDASRGGRCVDLESTCSRPNPLPVGLREGVLDE
jgi:predicted dehydrogenase